MGQHGLSPTSSSSMCTALESKLPRRENLLNALRVSPLTVIASSGYAFRGPGCYMTSVFLVLIVSPRFSQAVEKQFKFC